MATILELIQEKSTYMFLADGLTQEHQQSVKLDLLRKVDNLQSQINDLEARAGKTSNENEALPIPDVSKSFYCQRQIEGNRKCKKQCEHCKEYYKPLEQ
jgi:hypothetical protein